MGGDRPGGWDFFISYTQADREWAEWIAWVLEDDGHSVLLQAWDIVPGRNWIRGMHEGTSAARHTIAVLSPDYLTSEYGTAEWQAAWASDPTGVQHALLIIRVRECDRPGLLAGVVSIDLFGIGDAEARNRLRRMVAAAASGRAKPEEQPGFPGYQRAVLGEPRFPGWLPRVWKVPAPNPHFTGRTEELADLAAALTTGVSVVAVHGMGGVGKTQLATAFAHAHGRDYDVVYWIPAEEPALIPDQFSALASQLELEPVPDPELLQDQVHNRLRYIRSWLLIFDNADTAADIRPWLPSAPLSPGGRGHVIVTTRRGGFAALGSVLDLDVIDPGPALELLRSRVPEIDEETGHEIAEELGRLPLALEQAAAYLDRSAMPAREYLDLLRQRAADLYARGQVTGRSDTIATLWDISVERIASEHPAAVALLGLCAYLAPERIPVDLFTAHAGRLPGQLSEAAADRLTFSDVIATLVDYSLIKRSPAGLQVHRLIQGAIRNRYARAAPSRPRAARTPATGPDALSVLGTALGLLRADAPSQIIATPAHWPRWAVLLPHVLAATSHVSGQFTGPELTISADAAWLLGRAATYLEVNERLQDARPLAERALAIDESAHGSGHPFVALSLTTLSRILRRLGLPQDARPLAERALAITEASGRGRHPEAVVHLSNLAMIFRDLGLTQDARPLAERALAIDEAAYGPDDPKVAYDLHDLAAIIRDLGRPEDARPIVERALAITESAYGPDHPDVAIPLTNLARILRMLGENDKALSLAERALVIVEAAYGPDHSEVAAVLNILTNILSDLGKGEDALPLAERALAITEAAYGPHHPDVASNLNNVAAVLYELKQPQNALPYAERALEITESVYGADHPTVAIRLINLASMLGDLGQLGEALPLAERSVAIGETAYGLDHPIVAQLSNILSRILRRLGRPQDALPLAERSLAITEARYGQTHPDVAFAASNLAAILGNLGRPDDALPLAERALTVMQANYGPGHPYVAHCLAVLASTLRDLGRPNDALPMAERALAIVDAHFGTDRPGFAALRDELATLIGELRKLADLSQ